MTLLVPPNSKGNLTDLRELFASLVSDPPASKDQFGKLPDGPLHPRKRVTLHLNESVKRRH